MSESNQEKATQYGGFARSPRNHVFDGALYVRLNPRMKRSVKMDTSDHADIAELRSATEEFLQLCDEAGILVWEEALGWQNTLEDLSPSLLFHKFLDDSARYVCTELMTAEAERSPEERIFLVGIDPAAPLSDSAATDSALAGALLRFHGRHVAPTDSALDVWRWLLENTASSEEEPLLPWLNVCAGLITHPDFYAY